MRWRSAPEKIVSAMRAQMRALAENRGLDPSVAEAMVDEDVAIEGVVEAGKLLTLTTAEAVDLGYAEEVEDWTDLMGELDLRLETSSAAEYAAFRTLVTLRSPNRSMKKGSIWRKMKIG